MPPLPLRKFHTPQDLGPWLGLPDEVLADMLGSTSMQQFYTRHTLKARNRRGTKRNVFEADDALAAAQQAVAEALELLHVFPDFVSAYAPGRSTRKNASRHLSKDFVVHADIVDFFGSLTEAAVVSLFGAVGARPNVREALAKLCTLNGSLPQGARSSPILSNILAASLDHDLDLLARSFGSACTYTRYADDIVFSGSEVPEKEVIANILAKHEFTLNERKFKLQRRGGPQFVSGLCVCDPSKPRLPSKLKRQLELDVYYASRFGGADHAAHRGLDAEQEYRRVNGLLNYAMGIEREFAAPLRAKWREAFAY